MSFGFGDALAFLALPVTAIVARLFTNTYAGIAAGTLAGLAVLGIAMVLVVGDAFSEMNLEVPD